MAQQAKKSSAPTQPKPGANVFTLYGQQIEVPALPAGLHVVATPIGNLEDITLRGLKALAGAARIACEDTRVTAKLLNRYGIKKPLISYHEHNRRVAGEKLVTAMENGEAVALVSDAGTPLLSDPGAELVTAAVEAGFSVTPYPGASALLSALVTSGISPANFHFVGFLPPKQTARRKRLNEIADIPGTLVFYETAPRLASSLHDMADILGARPAAMCRELTKLHETIIRGSLDELAAIFADQKTKGEIVLVVGLALQKEDKDIDIGALLKSAMKTASLKEAVASVAKATGLPRRDVYAEALRIKGKT